MQMGRWFGYLEALTIVFTQLINFGRILSL